MYGLSKSKRATGRLRPYVAAKDPKGRWIVEGFFPKSVDYKKFVHPGSIRHTFRRTAIKGGVKHRVIIGCPVVDPDTGRRTKVAYKTDRRTGERYPVCSATPLTLNIWHPMTKSEASKLARIHRAYGKPTASMPSALAREVLSRRRNLERIAKTIRLSRGGRAVAGLGEGGSGVPTALWVTLLGVAGVAVTGLVISLVRKNQSQASGGANVKGLKDLPAFYPQYPRVMPSYEVPVKVHRDAQILQHQEVNAAGKVIIDEEIVPVQAERYIPNFWTGKRRALPPGTDVFEWGTGGLGTDRPQPVYPPDLEEVNATYEHVNGGGRLRKRPLPGTPEEFACTNEMGMVLDDAQDAAAAEDRIKEFVQDREGTAEAIPDENASLPAGTDEGDIHKMMTSPELPETTEDIPEDDGGDGFEQMDESAVDKALDRAESGARPAPAPAPAAPAPQPIASPIPTFSAQSAAEAAAQAGMSGAKSKRRKKAVSDLGLAAELGEYQLGREEDFEALEEGLMNGSL